MQNKLFGYLQYPRSVALQNFCVDLKKLPKFFLGTNFKKTASLIFRSLRKATDYEFTDFTMPSQSQSLNSQDMDDSLMKPRHEASLIEEEDEFDDDDGLSKVQQIYV